HHHAVDRGAAATAEVRTRPLDDGASHHGAPPLRARNLHTFTVTSKPFSRRGPSGSASTTSRSLRQAPEQESRQGNVLPRPVANTPRGCRNRVVKWLGDGQFDRGITSTDRGNAVP